MVPVLYIGTIFILTNCIYLNKKFFFVKTLGNNGIPHLRPNQGPVVFVHTYDTSLISVHVHTPNGFKLVISDPRSCVFGSYNVNVFRAERSRNVYVSWVISFFSVVTRGESGVAAGRPRQTVRTGITYTCFAAEKLAKLISQLIYIR